MSYERPLCRFFALGKCKYGSDCSFSHNLPEVPTASSSSTTSQSSSSSSTATTEEEAASIAARRSQLIKSSIPCKWFHQRGGCCFGRRCQFSHTITTPCIIALPDTSTSDDTTGTKPSSSEEPEVHECGVCLEEIEPSGKRFGLLSDCNHTFCIECLRKWRTSNSNPNSIRPSQEENGREKHSCPTCRVQSDLILPSAHYMVGERKDTAMEDYKKKMASIPCRYFERKQKLGTCPHGRDCYYAHHTVDGVDVKHLDSRRVPKRKRRGVNGGVAGTGMTGEDAVRTLPDELIALVTAMGVDQTQLANMLGGDNNTGNRRRRRDGDNDGDRGNRNQPENIFGGEDDNEETRQQMRLMQNMLQGTLDQIVRGIYDGP